MTGGMKQEFQARHGWIGHFYCCTGPAISSVDAVMSRVYEYSKTQHSSPLKPIGIRDKGVK